MFFSVFHFAVFAEQGSHHPPPTPIRLIEKYSKHEGREPWIGTPAAHETVLGSVQEQQRRVEELQRRKQQRISRGLQKRSVAPERPVPTSSPFCEPFENVDTERKTLSSPGSPNNYPNNTDCYVVLEGNERY